MTTGQIAASAFTPAEFGPRMAALRPFEKSPHIAVACSGGPDSLALTLLADGWARGEGGRVTGLIVDHGMRPDSAAEATTVSGWLATRGIASTILTRAGPSPAADRQAAARRARYALMRRWCEENGVLHLLLAHHRQDQAETFMLRLARGSGVDGLGAMAPVSGHAELRLLRPLLDVPRQRLVALLETCGQAYVDDPSNRDGAFARVRMRKLLPSLAGEGLTVERLAGTARRMARARAALEQATTALLAESAAIFPEGYALLSPAPLLAAAEEVALRALSRVLTCVGGAEHAVRLERLERLLRWLRSGAGNARTLGGCRIVRHRERLLVCREPAAAETARVARNGEIWDGRFRLVADCDMPDDAVIGPLGADGWRQVASEVPDLAKAGVPVPVRSVLPALRDLDGVLAVPHLNYRRRPPREDGQGRVAFEFQPARPLGPAAFVCGLEFS